MTKKGQAGYSARRRAQVLRRKHIEESLTWAAYATGGSALLISLVLRSVSVGSLAASGLIGVLVAVGLARRPSEASRWFQGAEAEKRTGKTLTRLIESGWEVLHDLKVPGSKANLDHVVIHPSGLFLIYIDTKAWHAKNAKIRFDRGRLMYGPWNKTQQVETVRWEAEQLAKHVGLTVVPVIVCDQGNVVGMPGSPNMFKVDDTYVIGSDSLYEALRRMDQLTGPDPVKVSSVARTIGRRFEAAQ